jgi:DNA-binding NarL/FixJ family response regulator
MKKKIRILIVDDHYLVRIGLATSLNAAQDMAVIAEASAGPQAMELYQKEKPDIVLMDLRLPGMSGEEATRELCQHFPDARVIMISTFEGHDDIFRSVQAGARSYLSKNVLRDELLKTIRAVNAGEFYLPAPFASRLMERMRAPELSSREAEVLALVVKGMTNKEIAMMLSIAEITVKNHVSAILTKLNASDRTQASTIAIQRGIVHLD